MSNKKSLADLMGAFTAKTQTENNSSNAPWKLFFQFWKADVGSTSVVRFLPDLDENNPMGFLVENLTHELMINGKKKVVACGKMYGDSCPICELSQKYYNEKSPEYNRELGYKFYRKKNYIGQILVQDTPLEHDQEQLVKLIEFGPKIFNQILAAMKSGDLETPPYYFEGGHNFRINKTQNGEYADYGTSSFAPRPSNVSEDLIEQIELFDLAKHRAPHVTREVLEGMLLAATTGGSYDAAGGDDDTPAEKPAKPAKQSAEDDVDNTPKSSGGDGSAPKMSVADRIRARQAAKQADSE